MTTANTETDPVIEDLGPKSAGQPSITRGRMTLLLIAGIPVTVLLASTWLWYYVMSGKLDIVGALGTANHGQLVQPPRQVMTSAWTNADGTPLALEEPRRWTLLIPVSGNDCDANCEQRLYTTRQIHQSLGKEIARVQRAFVTDTSLEALTFSAPTLSDDRPLPESFTAYLMSEQRGIATWTSPEDSFRNVFSELEARPDSWYLLDPAGWVMMRYDGAVDYKDVISDLKFLIKNSNG
ncbi:MAG: hypothetical protein AAF671_10505 [Pseudomonadota bacterium]